MVVGDGGQFQKRQPDSQPVRSRFQHRGPPSGDASRQSGDKGVRNILPDWAALSISPIGGAWLSFFLCGLLHLGRLGSSSGDNFGCCAMGAPPLWPGGARYPASLDSGQRQL
ncbi:hypothetical protein NDU88_006312 [Pleurodeles waltl]|uniref:Uncharacterized protein n=1 Tax=Pleurodeles waltl TaxID=8319 RepID=A0AAV7UL48_PLEWA|nr:hypothetical protein NDU88_006312 [Pleurodeles waltl]